MNGVTGGSPATLKLLEAANAARKQVLALNDGIKGKPLVKSATIVLGDAGFRLEVIAEARYKYAMPQEIQGIPVVVTRE